MKNLTPERREELQKAIDIAIAEAEADVSYAISLGTDNPYNTPEQTALRAAEANGYTARAMLHMVKASALAAKLGWEQEGR